MNSRLMNIPPKHYDRANTEAKRRRMITGQNINWQSIIRHAIELGIARAIQYTGGGQWPTTTDVHGTAAIVSDSQTIRERHCPATSELTDCGITGEKCRNCEKRT